MFLKNLDPINFLFIILKWLPITLRISKFKRLSMVSKTIPIMSFHSPLSSHGRGYLVPLCFLWQAKLSPASDPPNLPTGRSLSGTQSSAHIFLFCFLTTKENYNNY